MPKVELTEFDKNHRELLKGLNEFEKLNPNKSKTQEYRQLKEMANRNIEKLRAALETKEGR